MMLAKDLAMFSVCINNLYFMATSGLSGYTSSGSILGLDAKIKGMKHIFVKCTLFLLMS